MDKRIYSGNLTHIDDMAIIIFTHTQNIQYLH